VLIDACSGDGRPSQYSETSSPEIFAKHLQWLIEKRGRRAHGYLIEINRATLAQLQTSIGDIAQRINFPRLEEHLTLIHTDYRWLSRSHLELTDQSIIFLYIDPNNMNLVELPHQLMMSLPTMDDLSRYHGLQRQWSKTAAFQRAPGMEKALH